MHDQAIFSAAEKCRQHINNITNSFIPSLRQKILLKRNIVALQTHTRKLENQCCKRERYIRRQRYQTVLLGLDISNARATGVITRDTVVIKIKQP